MTKNKKRIAFIAILFCIVMMCSACSATNTDKVNEQAIANEQAALNEQIVKPWPDTVSYMVLSEQLFSEAQKNPYLKELIVPKEAREKWRGSRNDLADNQYLLNVVSMDKQTADCLKSWLAGY